MCTASVTVSIVCTGDANTPSPTVTSTDEIIPHGGDLNITDSPSAVPINPDGGDLNIAKPVANDDYYTTNQDESIEIAILENDTLIVGKFLVCPTISMNIGLNLRHATSYQVPPDLTLCLPMGSSQQSTTFYRTRPMLDFADQICSPTH
jgi:hypothetical protein